MKKGLLRQFPRQIRERIADQTVESYELRDSILRLIDKNPMFIIRRYLDDNDLNDFLEEKDLELIKQKLNSTLTYEWFYFKYKNRIKENMDKFIKDVAQAFAYTILFENRYEYDEADDKIKNCGSYNIEDYDVLGDFLCDYDLLISKSSDFSSDYIDGCSSYLDNIAVNYLHETLKELLKDVYKERRSSFVKFFKLDENSELSDRDFEELEYELFEVFDTEFPMPDLNNPVGAAADLISEVGKMNAKLLFTLGREGAEKKHNK
ncbi:MAG: hypothetical protein ACOYWZ_01650 [Bacillota bacterium]